MRTLFAIRSTSVFSSAINHNYIDNILSFHLSSSYLESAKHTDPRRRQSPSCSLQWEANKNGRNVPLLFCTDSLVDGKQDQSNSTELKEIPGFFQCNWHHNLSFSMRSYPERFTSKELGHADTSDFHTCSERELSISGVSTPIS